jgi:hypothetical protein
VIHIRQKYAEHHGYQNNNGCENDNEAAHIKSTPILPELAHFIPILNKK